MASPITVGVPQKFKALPTASGQPVTPTAQMSFTSADPSKVAVAPVAGAFDVFLATPLGGNADGTPATVGITCSLPGSATYTAFSGAPALQVNQAVVNLLVLQPVP